MGGVFDKKWLKINKKEPPQKNTKTPLLEENDLKFHQKKNDTINSILKNARKSRHIGKRGHWRKNYSRAKVLL